MMTLWGGDRCQWNCTRKPIICSVRHPWLLTVIVTSCEAERRFCWWHCWAQSPTGGAQLDSFLFFLNQISKQWVGSPASSQVTNERVWGFFWYHYELLDLNLFNGFQFITIPFPFWYSNHPTSCPWEPLQLSPQSLNSFLTCREGISPFSQFPWGRWTGQIDTGSVGSGIRRPDSLSNSACFWHYTRPLYTSVYAFVKWG